MNRIASITVPILLALVGLSMAVADEHPERPWSDTAEFGLVITTGNSETTNLSLSNKFTYEWERAEFVLNAFALRTETTSRTFSGIDFEPDGTIDALAVSEISNVTAESYALNGIYRRDISDRLFWYASGGWDKDEFAGIDSRYTAGGGVGYRFFEDDKHSLVGEIGANFTDESRTNNTSDSFAGARGFLGYARNLSETSTFSSELEVLQNLDESDDRRAIWINALTASVSEKMALKVSYTMKYDNQPVIIFPLATAPTLGFEFDDLDTILAASLVVNF